MLVIADVERALVIAGVFGSVDAEIDERTTDIVLEAANFAGPSILRTELHTGIRSEASNRFEKGIDPNLVPGGLDFADRLFAELCGGAVAPGMVDAGGVPPAPAALPFRPGKAEALLGYDVPAAEQAGILRRLECEVDEAGAPVAARGRPTRGPSCRRRSGPTWSARSTSSRRSGASPATAWRPRRCRGTPPPDGLTQVQQVRRAVRRALAGCGLDEAITYSFIAPDALAPLGLPDGDARLDPVRISNPMSGDQSVMRTTLLPGPAQDRARQPRPAQRRRRTCSRSARSTCGTSRSRRRRTRPSPAPCCRTSRRRVGIVLSGPLEAGELDRRRPADRLLHAQGRR